MVSSGTYAFNPAISSSIIEAYDRIGIRPPEITHHMLNSAQMSCNLVLSSLSNMGTNLWKVDLQTVPLVQGVATYSVPSNTVMILDSYIRQYAMNAPVNLTPSFNTQSTSTTVTVNQNNHGLVVSEYINIIIPVSVGGIILYGFYQVVSVQSVNSYTITASTAATANITGGGQVPVFTTTSNSSTVSVNLPNHGFLAGQSFVVQISTNIGGIVLYGTYTIAAITDANNFTFAAQSNAGFGQTVSENGGLCQIAAQQTSIAAYVDRIMGVISRTDYANLPNKQQQGFPTVYWFDRLLNPTITVWQVPDGNGPYSLQYYRVTQIQDASYTMGQTPDIPYRFQEAWTAGIAWHLARKWKPELEAIRKQDAIEAMALAVAEDRERVPLYLRPEFENYYY